MTHVLAEPQAGSFVTFSGIKRISPGEGTSRLPASGLPPPNTHFDTHDLMVPRRNHACSR